MVSYIYWFFVVGISLGTLYLLGHLLQKWLPAIAIAVILFSAGGLLYYFYLEQMFVKRWGGSMAISVPMGQRHVAATWKADHLWIENYDPEKNQCIFQEYSRGNVLEGKVIIKNCNPIR